MKKLIMYLIPKFVRKSIHAAVMDEVRERTNNQMLAVYAMVGIGFVINKGTSKISDEKMVSVCEGFELGGDTLKKIAAACNPKSENGRQFSEQEEAAIKSHLCQAVEMMLPQEAIDRINGEISEKVAEYLGVKEVKG